MQPELVLTPPFLSCPSSCPHPQVRNLVPDEVQQAVVRRYRILCLQLEQLKDQGYPVQHIHLPMSLAARRLPPVLTAG